MTAPFQVKTPLLLLSLELSGKVVSGGEVATVDARKLLSFLDALTRFVGEAAIGKASAPRIETIRTRWGNLPVYLQNLTVAEAGRLNCTAELSQAVGPLPEPEIIPARQYEPMF